jgi:hypothetical protein
MNFEDYMKEMKKKKYAKEVALRLKGITKVETLRSGVVSAYKDSVYEYRVTSTAPEEQVLEVCLTDIHKCNKENKWNDFSGSCSFPYGLNNFYSFKKIQDGVYIYKVCSPYCG